MRKLICIPVHAKRQEITGILLYNIKNYVSDTVIQTIGRITKRISQFLTLLVSLNISLDLIVILSPTLSNGHRPALFIVFL